MLPKRLFLLVALLNLLDALRLRGRARRLHVLLPSDEPTDTEHVFWAAPGVVLDDQTRASASAWARQCGLELLDLWPSDMACPQTLRVLTSCDPVALSRRRLALGFTAGQAMLVHARLLKASGLSLTPDPLRMMVQVRRLKRYARGCGVAIAPSLGSVREDPMTAAELMVHAAPQIGGFSRLLVALPLLVPLFASLWSRPVSLACAVTYQLKPLIATAGTAFKPRGLAAYSLFGLPVELFALLANVFRRPRLGLEVPEELRRRYAAEIGAGTERYFGPVLQSCVVCASRDLRDYYRSHDIVQGKPGSFTLQRCADCGHIFQNPRLSPEGLDFYYRDCYDGLGAEAMEAVFDAAEDIYVARARRVEGLATPQRWLDIGSGYGHFCYMAKTVWPDTEFDGLDLGSGIDEGERRGWLRSANRGLLTETSAQLRAQYDVASMFHYLEHTPDPRAELRSANEVLKLGGYLVIELPNPETPPARLLKRWWIGSLQPQHLNLLHHRNLARLLEEQGFQPERWFWQEASPANTSFTLAAGLLVSRIAPVPGLPWHPRPTPLRRLASNLLWLVSPFLIAPALLLDILLHPVLSRAPWSLNYSVVARKVRIVSKDVLPSADFA